MIGATRSWKSRKVVGKEKEGSVEGEVSDPFGDLALPGGEE